MKQFLFAMFIVLCSCEKGGDTGSNYSSDTPCGSYNGHSLYKGSGGGCYYINSNGNKSYVDKSHCNC